MLVFGDYVFIPFAFSVQCHYLLNYPDLDGIIGILYVLVNFALFIIGYYVFRTSNSQKNQFKTNPSLEIWG
jgi:delta14-sterol reductase